MRPVAGVKGGGGYMSAIGIKTEKKKAAVLEKWRYTHWDSN